ncbi:ISAon1 family transposase N-terminal region protein [Patiriisocius marinistellae]|uniref:ISAon1 family transposase N-terminal region protein n=1 Tax=Patiriisocius marinistellae TaxID=2494560 RepID=UPI003FCE1B17
MHAKYFDLIKYEIKEEKKHFYFTELSEIQSEFRVCKTKFSRILSKSYCSRFSYSRKECFLHITRSRWLNEVTSKFVTRNWKLVAKATRITSEFGAF